MPNSHHTLDSVLVALIVGFRELALEIEDEQGLHESSIARRIDDLRMLFNEGCAAIYQIERDTEVQE